MYLAARVVPDAGARGECYHGKYLRGESAVPDFERLWPRLQQLGLNAYEARTYLVLLGHPRFKAMEAAARANVPRQKIYEVLDSLYEKGFAEVLQEKTKSFSAVEPGVAIPAYLARKQRELSEQIQEQNLQAAHVVQAIETLCSQGIAERANLDYLRIINEASQTASHFRDMLESAREEYLEFARPPYAVDPLDELLVRQACARGVRIRLLIEPQRPHIDHDREMAVHHRERLIEYQNAGVEIREAPELPMKLALFDGKQGILALLDPLSTRQSWTAIRFDHAGFAAAMRELFELRWMAAGASNSLNPG
ncbi:MAG: TrmB family transcriptional regulator [Bryobacterales bacterium]|nr:TrmB family transcriptional regulator [Bryobacterales bacterium]